MKRVEKTQKTMTQKKNLQSSNLTSLEKRIQQIEERDHRVEADKAWETSWSRRILIALFTYLSISFYLYFIVKIDPWINAVVPSIGFLLSTLSLPFLKKVWIKHVYKKS